MIPLPPHGLMIGTTPAPPGYFTPIILPEHLRGYAKYIVVLHPEDAKTHSLGIKYVCRTAGAEELLQRLSDKRERKHRKSLQAGLCLSTVHGVVCPQGFQCPAIHCTSDGLLSMRPWSQFPPDKTPAATPFDGKKPRQGSLSPTNSVGESSRSSSMNPDEGAGDAVSLVALRPATTTSPLRGQDSHGNPVAEGDSDGSRLAPTLRLSIGKLALRQSLYRLRERVQQLESADPWGFSVQGTVVYEPLHPSNPPGAAQRSVCWADEMDNESLPDVSK